MELLEIVMVSDSVPFAKPLKGISSYKIAELKEICNKLDIDIIKKKKKELYNLIQEKL